MKIKLLSALTVILFLMPNVNFGQSPTLGTAAGFVLFSTAGAVTNSGIPQLTHLTGNVGTNSGSSTGFGNVDGVMHDGDVASGACAADLLTAYNQLNSAIPTFFPAPLLGNGDTLVPGVYHISSAATLSLNLVLNAQGNPNAVFIFQIQGAFSATAASKVILINGGIACNVFWKVEGLVSIATGTTMRGTIVAHNAAIDLGVNDTLEGRALSIAGAVTTNSILAYTPIGCGSAVLTGPASPALVSTAAYGIFSSIGPVTNTGITYVIGDVGTNSGLTTGFDPLLVTGMIHPIPDASTAACAADLTNVYNYLNTLTADIDLLYPAIFGNDLVLTPHTYLLNAATMLTGNVYLNAESDPNAVFIIQINGAFTTGTFSNIKLINGTQAKNVYWLVNGAVHVYDNSLFNGTIVAAGAITLNTGDTLSGRALTINGAVNINGSDLAITTDTTCVAPAISGTMQVCPGATTALTDVGPGGAWSSSNPLVATVGSSSGVVTGITPGTSAITYATPAGCVSTSTITVNSFPSPVIGPGSVCVGDSIILTDLTEGGTWSSSNASLATVGSSSGIVTGVANGTPTITYSAPGSCNATKSIIVGANAGVITGPPGVCIGSTITLADSTAGGSWTSSNLRATVLGGVVTGVSAGIDTIMYTVTNLCGTATTTKTVTVDSTTNAGSITGPSSVCAGSSIILTDTTTGGIWSGSNAMAIVAGGTVTGISAGLDTIMYTVANACGIKTATKTITVNPLPDEGSITGSSVVCVGSSALLTESITGGTWSSSNATATVVAGLVTGVSAGIDTIRYAVANTCGTATATKTILISPTPDAGTIVGPSGVCVGSSIILTDTAPGGIWSSSNAMALVIDGVVTGVSAGTDTIIYTVTNISCTSMTTKTVTVNPIPDAGIVSGPSAVCVGSSITLTDPAIGGTWGSSNAAATVTGGVVAGVSAGIDTIIYTVSNVSCTTMAAKTIIVNPTPNAGSIAGPSVVCVGSSITLTDAAPGGIWSASNVTALVAGGVVTGVSSGIDTISYTVSTISCTSTATSAITVNAMPDAGIIAGPGSVCVALSITLTDIAGSGVWSSRNATATVAGGIVTGVSAGMDTIMYAVTSLGCTATASKTILINPAPDAGVITGLSKVCVGSSITLTDAATGGTWSGSNTSAIVVDGLVTGVATGTDTIIYTVTNASCTATATKIVTVNPFLTAGNITGPSGVCIGSSITLTDAATGGVWSSSNATATIAGSTVTGVAAGTDTVRYTVTNACGTATAIKSVVVSIAPLAPVISTQSPSSACTGTLYQNFGAATLPPAGIIYNWTAVNATVWAQGTGHQYALVNFNETGTALVTLTATIPGAACASHSSVTVNVGANVAQAPQVSYFNSHFVCTPSNEGSYQWGYDNATTLDSTILMGEINQDYLNTSPDFYNKDYWVMTTSGGCLQKTYYHTPTAIQNVNSIAAGISVYPNPANTTINVDISLSVHGSITVEVLNMMGQKMNTIQALDNKATIDVTTLPAGTYLIACYSDGNKIAGARFVKN